MIMKKTKEIQTYLTYSKKLQVLKYAKEYGNNAVAYKFYGVKRIRFINGKKHMKNMEKKVYSERNELLVLFLTKLSKRL